MTVQELRRELANLPDDMLVILQKDAEGNGYKHLRIVDPDGIIACDHKEWELEIYDGSWSYLDAGMDFDEWESWKEEPRCLVLSP